MTDNVEHINESAVAIDGDAIRKIRESKRLTQLYVSKVVGVTTDTVSRWENNRYPTIRRDNAVKLAEALDADLNDILKTVEPEDLSATDAPASPKNKVSFKIVILVVLVLTAIGVTLYVFQTGGFSTTLTARRVLPAYAAPGSQVLIQVEVSAESPVKMIIKEKLPSGWQFIAARPNASIIGDNSSLIRWIYKKAIEKSRVFYVVRVPRDARQGSGVHFTGEVVANPDGRQFSVKPVAEGTLMIAPFHWADSNGNSVIDDMEILAVSDLTEETGDALVDWELLEDIWEAGGYRWDQEKEQFVPDSARGLENSFSQAVRPAEG